MQRGRNCARMLGGAITEDNVSRCVGLAEGLTEWVGRGGFLPRNMEHVGKITFGRIMAALWGSLLETERAFEAERRGEERRRNARNARTMAWLLM